MTPFAVIGFKTEYPNGREVEWVQIAPIGEGYDKSRTWHRVKDIRPRDGSASDTQHAAIFAARWDVIGPAYDAWKAGLEIPEGGTPLAAWAGVTPEQVAFLARMGIRTVEDVAAMNESAIQKLPWPNGRKMPETAKTYLEGLGASAQAEEMATLREQVAAMQEMLAEKNTKARKEAA